MIPEDAARLTPYLYAKNFTSATQYFQARGSKHQLNLLYSVNYLAVFQFTSVLTRSISNMIGYFIALLPLYVLVYVPISNMLSGSSIFSSTSSDDEQTPIFNSSFLAPRDDLPANCTPHSYDIQIISRSPLVLYLTNFLSDEEADHLIAIR